MAACSSALESSAAFTAPAAAAKSFSLPSRLHASASRVYSRAACCAAPAASSASAFLTLAAASTALPRTTAAPSLPSASASDDRNAVRASGL